MNVELLEAYERLDDIRKLFSEYAAWLKIPLDFQNFDEELASLPGKYAKPDGRLYLALAGGEPAGCIALRYFDTSMNGEKRCEMKRLFVRDQYKGHGLGRQLAERVIDDSRIIGYAEMLLDSFAFMESAVALYRKLGFEETEPYRFNPYENVLYLRLDLKK